MDVKQMKIIEGKDIKRFPNLKEMLEQAWDARECSNGFTPVGAAVYYEPEGIIEAGCNIEHRFRSHDIHAEVNAISSLFGAGFEKFDAIVIVAERERFTPCGSCMDWIMELGGENTQVMFQSKRDGDVCMYLAKELMPHYPF